ncbi:hypothetical protein ColLi_11439 [Colletotrichum liriopes]|uniref:Uncharacterized protein n=1 Tax=Colletotrichum liriopes TaxID=708192 RepID=A0AA37LYF7_9PEZI|nr:hypothetical protein ColLi_11439 [Colletotrichum liriopes]
MPPFATAKSDPLQSQVKKPVWAWGDAGVSWLLVPGRFRRYGLAFESRYAELVHLRNVTAALNAIWDLKSRTKSAFVLAWP